MNDLVGRKFNRLTVLRDSGYRTDRGNIVWVCVCKCGKATMVRGGNLINGHTKSCGCLYRETWGNIGRGNYKHGEAYGENRTRLYRIWRTMRRRCNDPKRNCYVYYGKKGIKVCDEWENDYITFRSWALANGYEDNLTIDRINNQGNYEPDNCQWLTASENSRKANLERRK